PVTAGTAEELLRAHQRHAILTLRDVGRRVHPELEELIARLLARDPAERPDSAEEAAVAVRARAAVMVHARVRSAASEATVAKAVVPAPVVASTEPAPRAAEVPEEA